MESRSVSGKPECVEITESCAFALYLPRDVLKKTRRTQCSVDETSCPYRPLFQQKTQQKKGEIISTHQPRQHLEQQTSECMFPQQQFRLRKERQRYQQRSLHEQWPALPDQQEQLQPSEQHLAQMVHFLQQHTRKAKRLSPLVLAALLVLLIVPRAVIMMMSFTPSRGVRVVSIPASGAVAVTTDWLTLPQTGKLSLSPNKCWTAAPRRLADEKRRAQREEFGQPRAEQAAKKEEGQAEVKNASVSVTKEERVTAKAVSRVPPPAGATALAGRKGRDASLEKNKEKIAPVALTKKSTSPAAKAVEKGTPSPARGGAAKSPLATGATAYAKEDGRAVTAKKNAGTPELIILPHGAVVPTSTLKKSNGTLKKSTAAKTCRKVLPSVMREDFQQQASGSQAEQKRTSKNTQHPRPHSGQNQDQKQSPAGKDLKRTYEQSGEFSTTMREAKPPGTNKERSVSQCHRRSTRDIPKSGLTKAPANSLSPPSNSASARSTRSHGGSTRNGAAAVTVEGAQLLESTTGPTLSPTSIFPAAGHGKRPRVAHRAAIPIGSDKTSDSDPAAVETDAVVQRNQSSTGKTSEPREDSSAAPAESATQTSSELAGEEQCMARQRVVEQRIADLETQVHSADTLIRSAADNQQRMFKTFQGRVQAVKDHLDAVQKDVKELEEKLANVGDHLATERFKQHAAFQKDLQTYIDSIGLNRAALRQAELSGKLDALHTMHDTLSDKLSSLASNLEDMEEKRRARLELATHKLQNVVEGRTSLAIAQLVTDAKTCATGMQQQLNDAKLDQILLAQAAKEVEERLREQKFVAVDISYVDETMSFGGITHAFAALLQTRFPKNERVLMYFVTVRPPALTSMAYASMFLVPSAENTKRLLSTVAVDPSVSEVVVKVESIMAEAWGTSPQRTHLQYLMPTPQEDIRVAGSVDYVYEFMKTMHKVIQELRASGEIYEGRPCVLVYTGMRRGVEAPADTPYTEFRKLQNLRYLVSMYASPVQETARLWHIMRNEVQLLDIFAPLQPVEVDGCHLRVYGGVAPFPEIPNSPFIKGGIMFVRLELMRHGTQFTLFPSSTLWLKILQYLARADRTKVGAFAVIKTSVTNMSRIRSRMLRLVRSLPDSELAVDIHSYQSTTRPPELRATESKAPNGGPAYASSEYHKGLGEAVESIIDTLTQSVLPYPVGRGFTLRRHLFVHVCEINVSCGESVST